MSPQLTIPLIDLNDFKSSEIRNKQSFVESLGNAFEEIGFVALKNHGLSNLLLDDVYKQIKQFFDLPTELKKKYEVKELAGQRGYTSFGVEHSKESGVADLKEFWHFGQELDSDWVGDNPYPPNFYVSELPEFNNVGVNVYKALENTGMYLMRAIALYLNLDEYYFDDKIKNGNSILRPIYYSPIHDTPGEAIRAGEHEDINLITLLMGASADGLEILNKKGEWIAVTALPDQIVVNVGDMLEMLTNNKLRSTTHRVVNPPPEKWHLPRYSIPFFLHPRLDVSLACLPQCVDDDHPKAFEDKTAGEFLTERLTEIGLLKK